MAAGTAVIPAAITASLLMPDATRAREYLQNSKSPATIRAYRSDWRHFEAWCKLRSVSSLPAEPQTIALYLSELAETHKVSTLQRRVAAISQAHQAAAKESPTQSALVKMMMGGIRRTKGVAQQGKEPVLTADLRSMVRSLPAGMLGIRDRAILLLGFAGAFRRSELVALNLEDLAFGADGVTVLLRRSKTDQEGAGRKVGVPYGSTPDTCPVRALKSWIQQGNIRSGALFCGMRRYGVLRRERLSGNAIASIVKRYAGACGKDPATLAGHSLRAGLVTSAAMAGVSDRSIMNQTGHRSFATLQRYIRDANLFRENAAARVGL